MPLLLTALPLLLFGAGAAVELFEFLYEDVVLPLFPAVDDPVSRFELV